MGIRSALRSADHNLGRHTARSEIFQRKRAQPLKNLTYTVTYVDYRTLNLYNNIILNQPNRKDSKDPAREIFRLLSVQERFNRWVIRYLNSHLPSRSCSEPRESVEGEYRYTMPIHNTDTLCQNTIPIHNTEPQCQNIMYIHNTDHNT